MSSDLIRTYKEADEYIGERERRWIDRNLSLIRKYSFIELALWDKTLLSLYQKGSIQTYTQDYLSFETLQVINALLQNIGYLMVAENSSSFSIYDIVDDPEIVYKFAESQRIPLGTFLPHRAVTAVRGIWELTYLYQEEV